MSASLQISTRHFGRKAVAALARKGISVRGLTALPGHSGSYLDPDQGYLVDDNGCGRVWTYSQVREAAGV